MLFNPPFLHDLSSEFSIFANQMGVKIALICISHIMNEVEYLKSNVFFLWNAHSLLSPAFLLRPLPYTGL